MRIALSTCMIQRGRSGLAKYVLSVARALIPYSREHEFFFLVLENDMDLFDFAARDLQLVPVSERWRSPVQNIMWHHLALPEWLRTNKIDVLHVPSYRRMLRSAPCALVTTIHDLAQFHVSGKYDAARRFYSRTVARQLCQHQDKVIAISRATAEDVVSKFNLPRDRVELIYNGIDHHRFSPGDRSAAAALIANRYKFVKPFFLYVSRIEHPAKNHVGLIDAFDQFRFRTGEEFDLVFVGSDWGGADVVHSKASNARFAKDIHFAGFVPDEIVPVFYRAAEALVFPSLFEGFGFPPVEAMACGCPVLASRCPALLEIISDSAGMFSSGNVSEMAAALSRVTSDPKWRMQLTQAGLEKASHFRWEKNVEQVLSVYRDAANDYKQTHRRRSGREARPQSVT